MNGPPSQFAVANDLTDTEIESRLRSCADLRVDPTQTVDLIYLDTFDWRLFRCDTVLESETSGNRSTLRWRGLDQGEVRASLEGVRPPRFARDLPKGPFRNRLEPVVEMRTLLPVDRVRKSVRRYRVVNADEKTVLNLNLEDHRLPARSGGRSRRFGRVLRLVPVRGYVKPFQRFSKIVGSDIGLKAVEGDPLIAALAAQGAKPGIYSSKFRLPLDPELASGPALRAALSALMDIAEANEHGVAQDLDTEFLHDFRVAARRTRSALTQVKNVLPADRARRFADEFRWLGQITGPMRDLDVYLLFLDDDRAGLDEKARVDLDPLAEFLHCRKKEAHAEMMRALRSARYRRLKRDLRAFLDSDEAVAGGDADRPIGEVASARIRRLFRQILKEGRRIDHDSPDEILHEMRKTGKKLRYLIEFFASLYSESAIKPVVQALKRLQDNLGEIQDLQVQTKTLNRFARQMMAEGKASAETFIAMGVLVDGFQNRRREARIEFAGTFAGFSAKKNVESCKALFTSGT
jgi:CHAD domain-containing protein